MATGTAKVIQAGIPSRAAWVICERFFEEHTEWEVRSKDILRQTIAASRKPTKSERASRAVKWGFIPIGLALAAVDSGRQIRVSVRTSSGVLLDNQSEIMVFAGREAAIVEPSGTNRSLVDEFIEAVYGMLQDEIAHPTVLPSQWRPKV